MVQFQVQDFSFDSLHFQKVPAPEGAADQQLELEQRLKIEGKLDGNVLKVRLALEMGQAELPFTVGVAIVGQFALEEVPEGEALESLIHINCAGILFPFVREAVADLTRKGGFPPLLLPPMNFVNLLKVKRQLAKPDQADPNAVEP